MMSSYERRRTQANIVALVVAISAVVALPALLVSWLLRQAMQREGDRMVIAAVMFISVASLYLLRERLWLAVQDIGFAVVDVDMESVRNNLGWLWLYTLPAAPMLALFLDASSMRNPEQQELDAVKRRDAAKERRRDRARRKALRAPDQIDGELVLGAAGEGDLARCVRGDYFV